MLEKLAFQQFQDKLISYITANETLPASMLSSLFQLTKQVVGTSFQNPIEPHLLIKYNQPKFTHSELPQLTIHFPNVARTNSFVYT